MMARVIFVRVLPNSGGVTFTPTEADDRGYPSFFSRVLKGVLACWVKMRHWLQATQVRTHSFVICAETTLPVKPSAQHHHPPADEETIY